MKQVQKQPLPSLIQRKLERLCTDPTATWQRLRKGSLKRQLSDHLLNEQGYLCAYCEGRVGVLSGDVHIDHLEPREVNASKVFDAFNMVASCMGKETQQVPEQSEHCGHRRVVKVPYDPCLFVEPTDSRCEQLFNYLGNGKINASPGPLHEQADYMIRHLKLDTPRLEAARRAAARSLDLEILSNPDLGRAEQLRLEIRDSDQRFTPYRSVLLQILREYGAIND